MTRADLIAALEKAEGPSRELDAYIGALTRSLPECPAEWLANWKGAFAAFCWGARGWRVAAMQDNGDRAVHWEPPRFSASIDAALTLVPKGMVWTVFTCDPPETDALFGALVGQRPSYGPLSMKRYRGSAATPALALCIAALRAALPIDTERPLTDEDRAAIANDPFGALKARE